MSLVSLYEKAIDASVAEAQAQYDVDASFFSDLKKVFMKHGATYFGTVTVTVSSNGVSLGSTDSSAHASAVERVKRHRNKTGYNLFVADQFNAVKQGQLADPAGADVLPKDKSKLRMKAFADAWKQLSKEQQTIFNERAKTEAVPDPTVSDTAGQVAGAPTSAVPAPRTKRVTSTGAPRVSGYNVFYRLNKDAVKAGLQPGEKFMSVIGALWTNKSQEEKNQYNALANLENTTGQKTTLADLGNTSAPSVPTVPATTSA